MCNVYFNLIEILIDWLLIVAIAGQYKQFITQITSHYRNRKVKQFAICGKTLKSMYSFVFTL